jgi:hypothetical protein
MLSVKAVRTRINSGASPHHRIAPDFWSEKRITDSDTITVRHDRRPRTIRLNGIDAPAKARTFRGTSKAGHLEAAFGPEVSVGVIAYDRYGRMVADVVLPAARSLNREDESSSAVAPGSLARGLGTVGAVTTPRPPETLAAIEADIGETPAPGELVEALRARPWWDG